MTPEEKQKCRYKNSKRMAVFALHWNTSLSPTQLMCFKC